MSEQTGLKQKTVSGIIWRFAERFGAQIVTFIVGIVLARLLDPEDYGIIAEVTVFITISQVFIDNGLGNALIQKKNADEIDFSTVFFFNIVMCLVLYAILWAVAPAIAAFYGKDELTAILRVLSLTVVISSVKNIQQAYVSRQMIFKRFFFATLGGTLLSAVISILMAYRGFGVWALVAQQLINVTVDTLILWITVKWRPIAAYSWERWRGLFSYGWKLLVSALIDTIYNNLRQLLIGKFYTDADLAYYNRGKNIPNLLVTNINSSIDSVLLPALSTEQDNAERLKAMTRRAISVSAYIMWPLMVGLAVIGEPLTRLLLTEKWLPSVPYLRIFCLVSACTPISTANLNAIKASGRSDIFLKLEIIKKTIGLAILIVALRFGVFWVAASLLVYTVIALVLNMSPNRKLLNYRVGEQLMDVLPSVGVSALMGAIVYAVTLLPIADIFVVLLGILVGAGVYLGGSILFRLPSYRYCKDLALDFLHRRHEKNS